MKGIYRHIQREFGPVYNEYSRILILGSFPSVKSREINFFYGHPRNRFWPLLAELLREPVPRSVEEKKQLLLSHGIALWDSIDSCDIIGSDDSSIRNVVPVDILRVLKAADIRAVFANGAVSARVYRKLLLPLTGRDIILLPSTSPANAAWSMERLAQEWRQILPFLEVKLP